MYFVDSGRPLTDAPPLLKTRRHMRRDAASKLWRKLQEQVGARSKPSGAKRGRLTWDTTSFKGQLTDSCSQKMYNETHSM